MSHQYRWNKDAFRENKVEKLIPPSRLISEQIWGIVKNILRVANKAQATQIEIWSLHKSTSNFSVCIRSSNNAQS